MADPHAAVTRRSFCGSALLAAAASAILPAHSFLGSHGVLEAVQAAPPDLVHDTFNALFAFVVPGSDAYSIAQGTSTAEPGGVECGAVDVFIRTLDTSTPYIPSFSLTVAGALNFIADLVHHDAPGSFVSPFARLSFVEKGFVFAGLDSDERTKLLGGLLPLFVAFFCYSEAGSFDPSTRSLTGHPLGWELSNYQGVSDGRDSFLGYFGGRKNLS